MICPRFLINLGQAKQRSAWLGLVKSDSDWTRAPPGPGPVEERGFAAESGVFALSPVLRAPAPVLWRGTVQPGRLHGPGRAGQWSLNPGPT